MRFIVQAQEEVEAGRLMICRENPEAALATANIFLDQGIQFVTIIADGHTYTAEEFALTIMNGEWFRQLNPTPCARPNSAESPWN